MKIVLFILFYFLILLFVTHADTFTLQGNSETVTWTLPADLSNVPPISNIISEPPNGSADPQGDFIVPNVSVNEKFPTSTKTTVEEIFFFSPALGDSAFNFGISPLIPGLNQGFSVQGQLWSGMSNAPIFNLGTFPIDPARPGADEFSSLTVSNAPESSTLPMLLFGMVALMAWRWRSLRQRFAV